MTADPPAAPEPSDVEVVKEARRIVEAEQQRIVEARRDYGRHGRFQL